MKRNTHPVCLQTIDVELVEKVADLVERRRRRLGPTTVEDQRVFVEDQRGAGLGRRIRTGRHRPVPRHRRQVQLPQVIERRVGAGAAAEYVHGLV